MYFCVAAACLLELMFIVRAPGRTLPGAWVCSTCTGKHITVVMLSAVNHLTCVHSACTGKHIMLSAIKHS